MARSRVIELKDALVFNDDRITEATFWDNGFLDKIADRVSDSDDRTDDIKYLMELLPLDFVDRTDENKDIIIFKSGFKKAYFEKAYETFKMLTDAITFDIYAGCDGVDTFGISSMMESIKEQINESDGPYIYTEDGYEPLDTFIRGLTENKRYLIGGTVVYTY